LSTPGGKDEKGGAPSLRVGCYRRGKGATRGGRGGQLRSETPSKRRPTQTEEREKELLSSDRARKVKRGLRQDKFPGGEPQFRRKKKGVR